MPAYLVTSAIGVVQFAAICEAENAPANGVEVDLATANTVIGSGQPQNWVWTGTALEPVPPTLPQAQAQQINLLRQAYNAAIQTPVSYTSKGGVTKTYQADPQSVANLTQMMLASQAAAATPTGFYWVSLDNTQVPFAYADMQGLAAAFGAQGAAAFQHLQTLKAEVLAATTVSGVQAINW